MARDCEERRRRRITPNSRFYELTPYILQGRNINDAQIIEDRLERKQPMTARNPFPSSDWMDAATGPKNKYKDCYL